MIGALKRLGISLQARYARYQRRKGAGRAPILPVGPAGAAERGTEEMNRLWTVDAAVAPENAKIAASAWTWPTLGSASHAQCRSSPWPCRAAGALSPAWDSTTRRSASVATAAGRRSSGCESRSDRISVHAADNAASRSTTSLCVERLAVGMTRMFERDR